MPQAAVVVAVDQLALIMDAMVVLVVALHRQMVQVELTASMAGLLLHQDKEMQAAATMASLAILIHQAVAVERVQLVEVLAVTAQVVQVESV
jgi:hypothetical protein